MLKIISVIIVIFLAVIFKGEENYILKHGQSLPLHMILVAKEIGISNPEGIRLLEKRKIFGNNEIGGLTIGRAILVKKGYKSEQLLCHELIHVKQYQDLGGIFNFLNKYFFQAAKYKYYDMPLEVEARIKAEIYSEEYHLTREEI
jgi:regulatory protein YycI of two-component signal transduction system YycFG